MEPHADRRWNGDDPAGVCRNPFATRYVACARLASRDARGHRRDVRSLANRLMGHGRSGAIVGPHGSGKSTLLVQLADHLEECSRRVVRLRLRAYRDGPATIMAIALVPSGAVVCIDGWERLGWGGMIAVLVARVRGAGLIVTSHHGGCLETLVECRTSLALLEALVADLPGHHIWFGRGIARSDLESSFRAAGGDLRGALGILYDLFERRVRGSEPSP